MFSPRSFAVSASFRRAAALAVLAASVAWCGISKAEPLPSQDQALKKALRDDLDDYLSARSSIEHISTLSMTVSFRGEPKDINMAVGTTQYGGGQKVTPSNVFQIGSNTKSFTSVLILQLEAEGVLCLDDTVGKWLPEYPAWSKVTIRQLLNMTSGIPTYDSIPVMGEDYSNNPYSKFTPEELVAYVYPAIKTPGAAWEYSNTGYILAQLIVDKATRWHSYETELDRLIARTELSNTFYAPNFYPAVVTRRLVSGYYVNTDDTDFAKLLGTDTSGYSLGWTQGAGGIIGTPQDLTKWVRDLFEGSVLKEQQKRELMSLVSIPGGQPIPQTSASHPQGFGLGVFQITDPSLGLFWGYQGSTLGYRAAYSYYPKSGLIICVFTNSQTSHDKNQLESVLFKKIYETLKAYGKIRSGL